MKCFTCGNKMKSVNDFSNEVWGWLTIYKCPKCGSRGEETVNRDGFIQNIKWQTDYNWEEE